MLMQYGSTVLIGIQVIVAHAVQNTIFKGILCSKNTV